MSVPSSRTRRSESAPVARGGESIMAARLYRRGPSRVKPASACRIESAPMNSLRVEIVEVGPRDGLQSEAQVLPTDRKVEFVRRLMAAGLRRIEVASFVNPQRVPQMADAEAVLAALGSPPGNRFIGLVLNRRGFER